MKKLRTSSIVVAALITFMGIAWASGGYKVINNATVQNPAQLVQVLNAMYDEITALRTLANELRTDHATTRTTDLDQITLVNSLRTLMLTRTYGNPALAINSNFDVTNAAFSFSIAGTYYTEPTSQNWDTGTAATFPTATWGIALLSIDASLNETVTWATNSGSGYSTEALAIAALPATPANNCPVGYITVRAHASNLFLAGTDALASGTGRNPAQTTNYYNLVDPKGTVGAAVSSSPPATLSAAAVAQKAQKGK